jgi:serine O-acetyltransferase
MPQAQSVDAGTLTPPTMERKDRADLPPRNAGDRNLNPPGIGFVALLSEDLQTHDRNPFEQGFWAVAVHRFGNWRMGIRPKLIRAPLSLLYRFLYKVVEWTCGISVPYTVRLGRRVRIWHHSGIVINAYSIGNDVILRQNTTMGITARGNNHAIPTIGDRVDIGSGVCIVGDVVVGNDSRIGANTLVVSDVPPGASVIGVPARIVGHAAPGDVR